MWAVNDRVDALSTEVFSSVDMQIAHGMLGLSVKISLNSLVMN